MSSELSRRDALRLLALAGVVPIAMRGALAAPATMYMRTIPKTGEQIPAIGLGTWLTFDVGSAASERAPLREVLREFAARGGRVVDTSPMYGEAETVVGDLASELGLQGKLFLATKVWTQGREAGIREMETSLRRLRTSRLDLMQVHNLLDWRTHLATLRGWKEQGRVRYVGITHYSEHAYGEIERIMKSEDIDFVQLNYSIASREAEARLLPLAQERKIGVLVNRPFEQGGLFGRVRNMPLPPLAAELGCASWAQFFLKFILSHPAVTCVLPATSKVKHLIDNMGAGSGRLPDARERAELVRIARAL